MVVGPVPSFGACSWLSERQGGCGCVADAVFLLASAQSPGAWWRVEWLSAQAVLVTGHLAVSN